MIPSYIIHTFLNRICYIDLADDERTFELLNPASDKQSTDRLLPSFAKLNITKGTETLPQSYKQDDFSLKDVPEHQCRCMYCGCLCQKAETQHTLAVSADDSTKAGSHSDEKKEALLAHSCSLAKNTV